MVYNRIVFIPKYCLIYLGLKPKNKPLSADLKPNQKPDLNKIGHEQKIHNFHKSPNLKLETRKILKLRPKIEFLGFDFFGFVVQNSWAKKGEPKYRTRTEPKYPKPNPHRNSQITEWFLYFYIRNNRTKPELNRELNVYI